jgi:hypothetical protein
LDLIPTWIQSLQKLERLVKISVLKSDVNDSPENWNRKFEKLLFLDEFPKAAARPSFVVISRTALLNCVAATCQDLIVNVLNKTEQVSLGRID